MLVVEDGESKRELFQLVLERAGVRVMPAPHAEEPRNLTATLTPDLVDAVLKPTGA